MEGRLCYALTFCSVTDTDVEGLSRGKLGCSQSEKEVQPLEDLGGGAPRPDGKYKGPGAGTNLVFYEEN